MKNEYFCLFDDVITAKLGIFNIPPYKFYAAVFKKDYEAHVKSALNLDVLFSDGVEIAQWRNGERAIPKRIYDLVVNNPDTVIDRYEEDIKVLFEDYGLTDEERLDDLFDAMEIFIKDMGEKCVRSKLDPKSTAAHLCACALVNVLFYDCVRERVSRSADLKLSADLKCIGDTKKKCRKKDVAFTNARIIGALLGKTASLLKAVLTRAGIGEKWENDIKIYEAKTDHRKFDFTPDYNDWLGMAMIHAGRNNRTRANEIDVLCAMTTVKGSSTLDQLWHDLNRCGIDRNNWKNLVLEVDKNLSESSFLVNLDDH